MGQQNQWANASRRHDTRRHGNPSWRFGLCRSRCSSKPGKHGRPNAVQPLGPEWSGLAGFVSSGPQHEVQPRANDANAFCESTRPDAAWDAAWLWGGSHRRAFARLHAWAARCCWLRWATLQHAGVWHRTSPHASSGVSCPFCSNCTPSCVRRWASRVCASSACSACRASSVCRALASGDGCYSWYRLAGWRCSCICCPCFGCNFEDRRPHAA